MSVKLYAYICGYLTIPHRLLLEGEKGTIPAPIPSYLIEHAKGRALFDSGLHLQAQDDLDGYIGAEALKYRSFHFHAGEEVSARLAALFFLSDESAYVTAQWLAVDSGVSGL